MFFSASERLAETAGDLSNLAERLDTFLEQANESWVLEPDNVASALWAPCDQVRHMLDLATEPNIGLLLAERYLRCGTCNNLMPIKQVREALEDGDEADCTQCFGLMTGKEFEATVYRLSSQAADEARLRAERPERTVVILTALEVEQRAVHAYLGPLEKEVHKAGTVYFVGRFSTERAIWRVVTLAVGAGNAGSAAEAERAIHHFEPEVALFVGIAGGINGVSLGDIVAANEVYLYHAGKTLEEFRPRPDVFRSAYALVQQARAAVLEGKWRTRLDGNQAEYKAIVEPIAAGEQVVASDKSDTYRFIRKHYDRAVGVEMEGAGFLRAAYGNQQVEALVVRGISDLLGNKEQADRAGWQLVAAKHAAAFSFELLANLP
jgi:nucleoside phosphorylase